MSKPVGPEDDKQNAEGTDSGKLKGERGFELITKLGTIEGLLTGLLTRTKEGTTSVHDHLNLALEAVKEIPTNIPTMAAKNTLEFSGTGSESANELIKRLKVLQLANGWSDARMVGQGLATLKSSAKEWADELGLDAFSEGEPPAPKFSLFEEKLKAKFPDDISLLCFM